MSDKPGIDNIGWDLQKDNEAMEAELLEFLEFRDQDTIHERAATTLHGLSNVYDMIATSDLSDSVKEKILHHIGVSSSEVMEMSMLGAIFEDWAYTDRLTGLKTTRMLPIIIRNMVRPLQEGSDVLVIATDINGLKAVNDSLSHMYGDVLISSYGRCLRIDRDDPIAIRVGGDEFVILVGPETAPKTPQWAVRVLSRLMSQLDTTASTFRQNLGPERIQTIRNYCIANNMAMPDFRVSMGASMLRKGTYRTFRVYDQCNISTTVERASSLPLVWNQETVTQLYKNLFLRAECAMYEVKDQVKR